MRRVSFGFEKDNARFRRKKAEERGDSEWFSEELKELINGMLTKDPRKRFTIAEIKNSKWCQGHVLKEKTLKIRTKATLAQKVLDEWSMQHQEWKEEINPTFESLEDAKAVKVCCI